MLPVAGDAVSVVVAEWVQEPIAGVAAVPFDPPLSFPIDLASAPSEDGERVATTARLLRDRDGWLTRRAALTDLPGD